MTRHSFRKDFMIRASRWRQLVEDIHRGFHDLDQTRDTQEFLQFLDAADALDSIRRYRQWMRPEWPGAIGRSQSVAKQ